MHPRLIPTTHLLRRTFLSFLPAAKNSSDVQKYHEQKVLPYQPAQLYAVVADVARYPRFVPFCTDARILRVSEQPHAVIDMEAELSVGFLAFKESYVSRVVCRPFESVKAVASSTTPLFETLETTWHFQPTYPTNRHSLAQHHDPDAKISTLVTLDLRFAFANPLYAKVSAAFFSQVSTMMVSAFEDECLRVYGPPSVKSS